MRFLSRADRSTKGPECYRDRDSFRAQDISGHLGRLAHHNLDLSGGSVRWQGGDRAMFVPKPAIVRLCRYLSGYGR